MSTHHQLARPHSPLQEAPARLRNYSLYRERDHRDIPWLRIKDFKKPAVMESLPRPIVLVNGAFDLLHSSHMRLIFAARHKAATLVCALDGDAKIAKEKGPERPILNWVERAVALNYMPIDVIVEICRAADMDHLMAALQPDLRVRSEAERAYPSRYDTKRMLVREGRIHTSYLVDRILRMHEKA